jgi:hypothetical protein
MGSTSRPLVVVLSRALADWSRPPSFVPQRSCLRGARPTSLVLLQPESWEEPANPEPCCRVVFPYSYYAARAAAFSVEGSHVAAESQSVYRLSTLRRKPRRTST